MIQSVLGHLGHNEVINYVDDSIVLGETFERHLSNIDKTLEAFSENGLLLKIENVNLSNRKQSFLVKE